MRWIGQDLPDVSGDQLDLDVIANDFVQEVGEIRNHRIQVDVLRLDGLPAGERQQLTSKSGGTLSLDANAREAFCNLRTDAGLFVADLGPAQERPPRY